MTAKNETVFRASMSVLGALFVALVLTTIGGGVGELVKRIPCSGAAGHIGLSYLAFIGIWMVTVGYMFFVKKERNIFKAIGMEAKGNSIKYLAIGAAFGFGTNMICAIVAMIHGDIHLVFHTFQPLTLLGLFACVFVQSSAEELVCRGFLYQKIRKHFLNPWVAIIGNAVLFGALHLPNPGVTPMAMVSIILIGVLYAMMVYYFDSIWIAMAAHTAWNFTQNILLGLPNSGMVSPYSMFKLDAASATNSFAYHTDFGLEATVVAIAVTVIAIVVVYIIGEKFGKKETYIWEA